jgi:hypothetical protein
MSKQKINMVGGGFQHDICSSAGSTPKLIEWVKGNHTAPISIHVGSAIHNQPVNKNKKNFAWLQESKTIVPQDYDWVKQNINLIEDNFELLFTHDKSILRLSDKIKLVICNARPWVKNQELHHKTKLVSMIASSKIMCPEHQYRQKIIQKFRNKLDLFGRGFRQIQEKDLGLKDYMFSIAMENGTYSLMYTEKITDCFSTGTIPIYYGSSDIGEVFNPEGIITLDENFNIENLSLELYNSKLNAVKENFEITKHIPIAEDYIYKNFIK